MNFPAAMGGVSFPTGVNVPGELSFPADLSFPGVAYLLVGVSFSGLDMASVALRVNEAMQEVRHDAQFMTAKATPARRPPGSEAVARAIGGSGRSAGKQNPAWTP